MHTEKTVVVNQATKMAAIEGIYGFNEDAMNSLITRRPQWHYKDGQQTRSQPAWTSQQGDRRYTAILRVRRRPLSQNCRNIIVMPARDENGASHVG